ncbi:hypothetical protein O9929_13740 [Vibrio lentus]|nr:hypothetical protein [Vibrio lentus]
MPASLLNISDCPHPSFVIMLTLSSRQFVRQSKSRSNVSDRFAQTDFEACCQRLDNLLLPCSYRQVNRCVLQLNGKVLEVLGTTPPELGDNRFARNAH